MNADSTTANTSLEICTNIFILSLWSEFCSFANFAKFRVKKQQTCESPELSLTAELWLTDNRW